MSPRSLYTPRPHDSCPFTAKLAAATFSEPFSRLQSRHIAHLLAHNYYYNYDSCSTPTNQNQSAFTSLGIGSARLNTDLEVRRK